MPHRGKDKAHAVLVSTKRGILIICVFAIQVQNQHPLKNPQILKQSKQKPFCRSKFLVD